ncbi:MAG: hypothetical protein AAF745_07985 [Planctomycetota bacterium]
MQTLLILICCFPSLSGAQAPSLLSLFAEASYQPPTPASLTLARSEATTRLQDVESYLLQHDPSGQWRLYLQLDALANALSVGELSEAARAVIDEAYDRMFANIPGLETPAILSLRRSLRTVIQVDAHLQQTELADVFRVKQRELVSRLGEPDSVRNLNWFRDVQALIAWFDEHEQAATAVVAAKALFSRPNMIAAISAPALAQVTRRPVDESEPICEMSDGRLIHGRAVATGVAEMIPSTADPAQCRIVFDGQVRSTLNGSEGPVVFRLGGLTRLHVEQPVTLSVDAFAMQSTLPNASTQLWTDRVATKRQFPGSRLVRSIARRMIAKERPVARQSLNENSRDQFVEQFQADVAAEMAEAFAEFQSELISPLDRLDVRPDDLQFVGMPDRLQTRMTLTGGYGLGAPGHVSSRMQETDLAVSIHESVVNRLAQRLLAGETFTDLAQLAQTSGIELTDEQLAKLPDDFAITFSDQQPVTARIEDDVIEITVRGAGYEVGGAVLVAMNATIRYRVVVEEGHLVLLLDGEPVVTPPADGESGRFYLQKNVLEKRLINELPSRATIDPIEFPPPADRLGLGRFASAIVDAGWFQIQIDGDRSF